VSNAAIWTDWAIAALAFARTAADVTQFETAGDNARYMAKLKRLHPLEHARLEAAITARREGMPA
jgi:hypothetical protein